MINAFLSKLILCKTLPVHFLLKLSLFEYKIPYKKHDGFHVQIVVIPVNRTFSILLQHKPHETIYTYLI